MKKAACRLVALLLGLVPTAQAKGGGYVHGYTRSNGTYVAPYYRGGTSTSSSSYVPTTTPTVTPVYTPARMTTLPPNFIGKPCGQSFIAQGDTCHIGEPDQKTAGFQNCTEAWANGVQDIPTSSPAYADKLDRDHDGIACEVSDMYDGNTWMYGSEEATPATQEQVSSPTMQLSCAGLQNIPQSSEFYHIELDRNRNGIACESDGSDNFYGVPITSNDAVAPTHGVLYVSAKTFEPLGSITYYGDGKIGLHIAGHELTFQAGKAATIEGQKLEAAPYGSASSDLMIPLSAIKLAGCRTTLKGQQFNTQCPDNLVVQGIFNQF